MVQVNRRHHQHAKRVLLSSLESVLCRLYTGDSNYRQDLVSVNKMLAGDTIWATRKVILGWLVDIIVMMIQIHHHHLAWLFEILDTISHQQRHIMLNKWHNMLGELHSMVSVKV
jgi:hypothetical protein